MRYFVLGCSMNVSSDNVKKIPLTLNVGQVASNICLATESKLATASPITKGVLAEEVEKIDATYSDVLTTNILDIEQCKELKMGSYLGVVASANPPKFIHLCYKPPSGSIKTKLTLVGKGLTFDRGPALG
ncbi:hypothetical protein Lser_V15G05680 [Lactuca serriola]